LSTLVLFSYTLEAQKKTVAPDPKMKVFIDGLMKKMTIDEKIGQLNLPAAGDITRVQSAS